MDKKAKALAKIPAKQRAKIIETTEKIIRGDISGLDVKKIKGSDSIYRTRVGSYRVIFNKLDEGNYIITAVSRRNEKTYKDV